ncbi:UNVERIFIED_CONTAM: hypothetical protein Sindi_2308500 [Sesamum indicum]
MAELSIRSEVDIGDLEVAASPTTIAGDSVWADDKGPTLVFTDAETEALAAPFQFALVGKFSHGTPLYSNLHKLIAGTGLKGDFTVSMLNSKHALIFLSSEADYSRLWLRQIWCIQGYPMRVFKWTPIFTPLQESSIVPIWVNFLELPAYLFCKDVLFTVASMIGTPLQIDDATLNQSKLSKARVCIELDLLKPRLQEFKLQTFGETIVRRIEYEKIPHYYFLCKHVGIETQSATRQAMQPNQLPESQANVLVLTLRKGRELRLLKW